VFCSDCLGVYERPGIYLKFIRSFTVRVVCLVCVETLSQLFFVCLSSVMICGLDCVLCFMTLVRVYGIVLNKYW